MISRETRNSNQSIHPVLLSVGRLTFALVLLLTNAKAGPFLNLNFESSPVFPAGDYNHPFTVYGNALPGWKVNLGTNVQNGACANEFLLDAPAVALMTSSGNLPPIEGQKNVYLQSSATLLNNPASVVNVSISQVGLVPPGSKFLRFKARNQWYSSFALPPGPMEVRLAGQRLPLVPIRSNGGDVEYAGDVSQWASQTVELSIGVLASNTCCGPNFPEGWALVDSISFQPGVLLEIAVTSTNTLLLSWPTNAVDSFPLVLHRCSDFSADSWEVITNAPTYSNGTNSVVLPLPSAASCYRLKSIP